MIVKLVYQDTFMEGALEETKTISIIDEKEYIRFCEEETDREDKDYVLRHINLIGYRFEFLGNESILFVNPDVFRMDTIMTLHTNVISKFKEVEDFVKAYNRDKNLEQL